MLDFTWCHRLIRLDAFGMERWTGDLLHLFFCLAKGIGSTKWIEWKLTWERERERLNLAWRRRRKREGRMEAGRKKSDAVTLLSWVRGKRSVGVTGRPDDSRCLLIQSSPSSVPFVHSFNHSKLWSKVLFFSLHPTKPHSERPDIRARFAQWAHSSNFLASELVLSL